MQVVKHLHEQAKKQWGVSNVICDSAPPLSEACKRALSYVPGSWISLRGRVLMKGRADCSTPAGAPRSCRARAVLLQRCSCGRSPAHTKLQPIVGGCGLSVLTCWIDVVWRGCEPTAGPAKPSTRGPVLRTASVDAAAVSWRRRDHRSAAAVSVNRLHLDTLTQVGGVHCVCARQGGKEKSVARTPQHTT